MLYTVVSEYDIFCSDASKRNYLDINGGKLEYIGFGRNRKIVGLFSTDPAMYLKSCYQPGRGIVTHKVKDNNLAIGSDDLLRGLRPTREKYF